MARIVYAHEVVPPAKRGSATAKKKRATPKTARSVPKAGPKAPLVEAVTVLVQNRTVLAMTLRTLANHLRDAGCPASAALVEGHGHPHGDVVIESYLNLPAWRVRWDEVYPSQNVLMRKYSNPHAYKRLLAMWTGVFRAAMLEGKIPKAVGKRRLTITRFVRDEKYRLDRGNLIGGGKPFLDAAVQAGLIRNDREDDVDDRYQQAIDPDERVEILVEDI